VSVDVQRDLVRRLAVWEMTDAVEHDTAVSAGKEPLLIG
jgi:hypothetical protein